MVSLTENVTVASQMSQQNQGIFSSFPLFEKGVQTEITGSDFDAFKLKESTLFNGKGASETKHVLFNVENCAGGNEGKSHLFLSQKVFRKNEEEDKECEYNPKKKFKV